MKEIIYFISKTLAFIKKEKYLITGVFIGAFLGQMFGAILLRIFQ